MTAAGISGDQLKGVDLSVQDAVSGAGPDLLTDRSRSRLQDLSYFQEKFLEAVSTAGFSTPALRLRAVSEEIDRAMFPDVDRFVFAGFFSLNNAEEEAAPADARLGGLLSPSSPGGGHRGRSRKTRNRDRRRNGPGNDSAASAPEITFTKCPDTHGQVFALNAVLRDRLADPARFNERQVVVLPAPETLFPLYQQTLADLPRDQFNISLGYPLTRTPIFTFFERLLEVLQIGRRGRADLRAGLHAVRSPSLHEKHPFPRAGAPVRPDPHSVSRRRRGPDRKKGAGLLVARGNRIRARRPRSRRRPRPREWRARRFRPRSSSTCGTFTQALIEPLRTIATVGDFAEKLIRILDYVYENGTARRHYFFHPYAEAFVARLETLAGSLLRDVVFEEREGYFNLFRKVAAAGTVPFFGTPLGGLQVLGFWETRGIPFEDVYLLDVNEDVLPASRRVDSLLPLRRPPGSRPPDLTGTRNGRSSITWTS